MSQFFEPWVGNLYRTEGLNGVKLLILGESHYSESGYESPDDDHSDFTRIRIGRQGKRGKGNNLPFFTKTAKLVLDRGKAGISNPERRDFWSRVAFCNYIQEFVAKGPGGKRTAEMWESGRDPLLETIKSLDPNALLVLGKALKSHLPSLPDGLHVRAVDHPQRWGWKYQDWMPGVQEFLTDVRES